MTGETMS